MRDGAEPVEEACVARLLPILFEMGDEAGDEHQVDWPTASCLVSDVEVTTARVADQRANLRRRRHRGRLQVHVLTENAQLQLLERRTGVDPELLDERPASVLEHLERVGLPAAAVEREHQLSAQTLAKRVLCDERLELRHEVPVAAECQVSVEAVLDRSQS